MIRLIHWAKQYLPDIIHNTTSTVKHLLYTLLGSARGTLLISYVLAVLVFAETEDNSRLESRFLFLITLPCYIYYIHCVWHFAYL